MNIETTKKTATVIVMFADSTRHQIEMNTPGFRWTIAMRDVGSVVKQHFAAKKVAGFVYIEGTEVNQYNANEAIELLGLEG